MTMVMKESMRLYPTAPSTFRKTSHSCNIGGYDVPVATMIMVCLLCTCVYVTTVFSLVVLLFNLLLFYY